MKSLYRNAERPYYHQGCWEGLKKETKKIIVQAEDMDENIWPVVITYEIVEGFYVTVVEENKLDKDYVDLRYQIIEAIVAEEGKVQIEF